MKKSAFALFLGSVVTLSAQAATLECSAPAAEAEMKAFRVLNFEQIYVWGTSAAGPEAASLEDRDARQFDAVQYSGDLTLVAMANECDNMYTAVFNTAQLKSAIAGKGTAVTGRIEYAYYAQSGQEPVDGSAPMICQVVAK